jgi:hypothetical protein
MQQCRQVLQHERMRVHAKHDGLRYLRQQHLRDISVCADGKTHQSAAAVPPLVPFPPPLLPCPLLALFLCSAGSGSDLGRAPSRHLWLGNLHARLSRALLRQVFEAYGAVEDVVTFPGRMYAFVNFKHADDAQTAAEALQVRQAGGVGPGSFGWRPAAVL